MMTGIRAEHPRARSLGSSAPHDACARSDRPNRGYGKRALPAHVVRGPEGAMASAHATQWFRPSPATHPASSLLGDAGPLVFPSTTLLQPPAGMARVTARRPTPDLAFSPKHSYEGSREHTAAHVVLPPSIPGASTL